MAPAPAAGPVSGARRIPEKPIAGILAVVATLIGLVVLAWGVLYVTKGRFLKPTFQTIASRMAEREVRVAGDFQLYFAPFRLKFLAEGLTVSNPDWAARDHLFTARLIDARIAPFSLIWGRKRVETLLLDQGRLDLEWEKGNKRNTWTFGDPNAPGEPLELPLIRRATVAGTELRYVDPALFLETDIAVDTIRAQDTQVASDVRFRGTGAMRAKPFTLTGRLLSPNETVTGGRNRLVAQARSGGNILDVSGTLPAATQIEGANLRVGARGPDLARLFDFLGVAVPDTRAYRFTSRLTYEQEKWKFTRLAGYFGESDLAGLMTISMPNDRLRIDADLESRSVDIVDVGPFIGYDPQRLEAQGASGAIERVGGTPRLLPDAPLRSESIAIFDAHVDYRVKDIKAPNLPVTNVALTLDLDRSLLKLSPLTFDLSRGHVASDISINARKQPVFTEYDIRLSPTPMGTLLAGWGVEQSGTSGVIKARIQMNGRGDSLRDSLATSNGRIAVILPKGSFWTRNIQLAELDLGTFVQKMFEDKLKRPVEINCGLIAFTVKEGIASADPILIDTSKNVMLARGGFSFRDESIDLAFRADSKKFSLFAGQSPVGINGYFAAPGFSVISPQLLSRAGAGIGIAAAINPLAAVLAFVDIGDAKSADCGPVLNGANAVAQRTSKGEPRKDVRPTRG